jgi:hypothetical protein
MSTDSKEDVPNEEDNIPLYDDRDLILSKLNDAIEYLHNKALKGRVMDAQMHVAYTTRLREIQNLMN